MELTKGLGLAHVFSIAAGAMISSGLFVLPGIAYARAGPAVVVSYVLAGLLAATGLLSTAELATAMPKAGSDYFFITRGMGPAVGTVAGVFNWVSFSLKSAFALVGMGALVHLVAPVHPLVTGVVLGCGFVALNLVEVKETARLQLVLVALLLALMVFYVVRALPVVDVARFQPFVPRGWVSVFSTAGFVFVAYGGLLNIASVAEEVKNPGWTIPAGMLLALVLVGALYAAIVGVTCGMLSPEQLSGSLTPITDGATVSMGRTGAVMLGVAAGLAFLTTANAGILVGSRYLLAMSRDGMLPGALGRVGARFQTPHLAIFATGALVILPLFINLRILVEAASIGLILTNILANLSVIALRESKLQNYRPRFRAPLYPWLQIVGVVGFAFVLLEMREEAFLISACLGLVGFCVYWFYGRARVEQESALLHLVARVTARELVTGRLEAELKEIIRERDEIVRDRFDVIIEKCVVLDLPAGTTLESFTAQAADRLSPRTGVSAERLKGLLLEREKQSSTVLGPGLAVPHVVIEGRETFDILLARSRDGIAFSEDAPKVHAVFVLVGTRDERNFHLRTLAAIAQVVQDRAFEERWLAARDEQGLRDLVLLGERRRE
jgi:amino acid transporter